MTEKEKIKLRIRRWIVLFIVLLVLSGITAFPIKWELDLAYDFMQKFPKDNLLSVWYFKIHEGISETYPKYPFIAYGTDWLAFAHIVIAVAFIGPLRNPVKNIWVIEWGMIACALVIPLAMIAGEVRGIPFFWRLIDCSFGVFGMVPLWLCWREIKKLN